MGRSLETKGLKELLQGNPDHPRWEVSALINELCQRQVKTALDLRPRIHRNAEAGAARLAAIDRDDKGVVAANLIAFAEVLAGEKDPILNGYCAQFAGAHADEGKLLNCLLVFDNPEAIAVAPGLPEPLDRRVQVSLPGMWSDSVAEQRRIGASLDSVSSGVLSIGPSDRQIVEMRNGVVDDGAVAHTRAHDPVSAVRQGVDDALQDMLFDHELGVELILRLLVRRSLLFTG
jgi:hypothetical protein